MDIFINGKQGAGKTRVAETIINNFRPPYGRRLHDNDVLYLHQLYEFKDQVKLLVETIRAARVRAVVFDGCITNGADLLICVQAVKEYRVSINADILALYVQQVEPSIAYAPVPLPSGGMLAAVPDNLGFIIEPETPSEEDRAKIEKAFTEMGSRATLPVYASAKQIPLTYDEGTNAYTAANLVEDGKVMVEATNVYAFEGALRLGSGHREPVSMLFELAEVNPVSNLHIAVDKMNTHYFRTGTFEKRAFNAKNCRPATPAEVMEYLNLKLKYQNNAN